MTRLTEAQELEIVKMRQVDNMSLRAIAKKFNVHHSTISNVLKRRGVEEVEKVKAEIVKAKVELETIDVQKERVSLINTLKDLLQKAQKAKRSRDIIQIVKELNFLLYSYQKGEGFIESLTLVDARSITFETIPEDVRRKLRRELSDEIWGTLCPSCKEALSE